jgi:hypothetical protein
MIVLKSWVNRLVVTCAIASALILLGATVSGVSSLAPGPSQDRTSDIFTPAHPSVLAAVRDFLGIRPEPVQPIAFTHKVHLAYGFQCENCHVGVNQGPEAGIPSVQFCMSCHRVIAADKPEIKKMAAYLARGEDIPWARVYDYSPSAHLKFNHAPHIRANVPCSTCHGDLTKQTTAQRVVNLDMGRCIECHKQRDASVDCLTCHT